MDCTYKFSNTSSSSALAVAALGIAMLWPSSLQAGKDMGNGFVDHGVAAPISHQRGTVATVDGNGKNVVLSYVMDKRGGYQLLLVDAATGKTEEYPIPFKNVKGDSPFASLLSSTNKFYTHYGDNFVEFDPVQRKFTFTSKTTPQMSMGMTEDDNGVIWSVSYPDSAVLSFNPKTREFKDYGSVYKQNWPQYQRPVAADDKGIIYFGIGMTATQIIAFDPATGKGTPLLAEGERKKGTAFVYRNKDGKVYGQALQEDGEPWFELYNGKLTKIGEHKKNPKPIITFNQALVHKEFPDGSTLVGLDMVDRKITVMEKDGKTSHTHPIDYTSEGAGIMSFADAPDGTITGGTMFPMRSFSYSPATDKMINRPAYGQWNIVTTQGDQYFVGGYPRGYLLQWDANKPWVNTDRNKPESNPLYHVEITPVVHRPHCLVALKDGSKVIMGGTPEYGFTGGGMLIWDRKTNKPTTIKNEDLVPDQSPRSMVELPGNKLLIGTTIEAGTGGERKAKKGELVVYDLTSQKVLRRLNVEPGFNYYNALYLTPDNKVVGFGERTGMFVLDENLKLVQKRTISHLTISPQGPRVFLPGDNGKVYVLLQEGIGLLDVAACDVKLLAKAPVELEAGGAYKDGRVYFSAGSHLWSWKVSE